MPRLRGEILGRLFRSHTGGRVEGKTIERTTFRRAIPSTLLTHIRGVPRDRWVLNEPFARKPVLN